MAAAAAPETVRWWDAAPSPRRNRSTREMQSLYSEATVRVVLPQRSQEDAVIVNDPGETPVASPAVSMVATPESLLAHVTRLPTTFTGTEDCVVVPSPSCP